MKRAQCLRTVSRVRRWKQLQTRPLDNRYNNCDGCIMREDKENEVGRSIQAIRLHIRRLSLAIESDRALLTVALSQIDEMIAELTRIESAGSESAARIASNQGH